MKKLVSILMMAIMMVMVATPVFASDTKANSLQFSTVVNNLKPTTPTNTTDVMTVVSNVLGFIQWAAIIGGIIIISVLGIKYMMGSLEEKAEYKKSLIPLIVGIVVVMGATSIASILFNTFALK